MSKQADAKLAQGYEAKPIFPMCSNCINFRSDKRILPPFGYIEERNIRCGIGDFAIKKQGNCTLHKFKETK